MLVSKAALPNSEQTLPGRATPMQVANSHHVHGRPILPPFPVGMHAVHLGMGCFWGAERKFWSLPGVYTTAAGYGGGQTPNPSYEEVCSGRTGHTELVLVLYQPLAIGLDALLKVFWESHDPTQGMRQGNDRGTQYRSAIYVSDAQIAIAIASRDRYAAALLASRLAPITTELRPNVPFYYAETYHQQYLSKNPNGYCGLAGTGVSCPIGVMP